MDNLASHIDLLSEAIQMTATDLAFMWRELLNCLSDGMVVQCCQQSGKMPSSAKVESTE